jgi:hypothetical protein
MPGYKAYIDYIALKRHFSSTTYDYHKYGGKIKTHRNSYEKRHDKYWFEKLVKDKDYHDFLITALSRYSNWYIRDIMTKPEVEELHLKVKGYKEAFSYRFKEEVNSLPDSLFALLKCGATVHSRPLLFTLYLQGDISLETLCIILDITGSKRFWDQIMVYDPEWEKTSFVVNKYTPFLQYDKDKAKEIAHTKYQHSLFYTE